VCIVGYLRPEKNFESLESLISAIQKDINDAKTLLDEPENLQMKEHDFFKNMTNKAEVITTTTNGNCKTSTNGHL
jgi:riboflavin kinase